VALSRRTFLLSGAASGAFLLGRPAGALTTLLGSSAATAASRASKLFPASGLSLVHADLHNHSLLSDGDGDPANAFASMRTFGVDVAALTDHATTGKLGADCDECGSVTGIDEAEWQRVQALADAENADGGFVALRGFEWSSPQLGHMNVWFSTTWTDPLTCGAVDAESIGAFFLHEDDGQIPGEVETPINTLLRTSPTAGISMTGFYDWLAADPSRPILGGGSDGIVGFNHPGREAGRFGFFRYDARLASRVVSMELFNRGEDYLFEQIDTAPSPLVECLDKGWKVGLTGVSDEHGTNWGQPEGKGRTGLWVRELTRAGVREAMTARRFFCTRERGLRVDAAANGVQMGGRLTHTSGIVPFTVDIDKGTEWWGRAVRIQVLQTGRPLPTIVHELDATVPTDAEPAITFECPIDRADGEWVVVRVTDPSATADERATGSAFASAGRAVAYASPFFLT
jgi:hypothetical protein